MTTQPKPAKALDPEAVALAKAFETHYNAHDAEKVAALFAADGRYFLPFYEPAEGIAAIKATAQDYYKERDPRNVRIETLYTERSGDVGFSLGVTKSNVQLPDGKRADISANWVSCGRIEAGVLKIVALMLKLDQPPK